MRCETRASCRNEAELWIHLNGQPKRSCVACSSRAIREEQWVESHWHASLEGPCPTAEHRALTPTERADILQAEDRAHGQAIPLPPPAEEVVPSLFLSATPPTVELPQEQPMAAKVLTYTLRPDADAHPDLCRVAECPWGDKPPRGLSRGLCPADSANLRRAGLFDAFALPKVQGKAKPKAETPLAPLTASTPDVALGVDFGTVPPVVVPVPVAVPTVECSPAETLDLSDLTVEEMGWALGYTSRERGEQLGGRTWNDGKGTVIEPSINRPGRFISWPRGESCSGEDSTHPSERAAMERLYRLALKEGRALCPIPVRTEPADPPPAPVAPAVVTAPDELIPPAANERLTRLNAELALWRDLADASGDALEAIAEAMDCEHDPDKPIGPQLVQRAQNLLNLNREWETDRDQARRERDEALAARDRSQNEMLALASEVKHLSQRAELAEDAATERRYELDTALQTYADLRAKLCEVFGEDPAELTDQGIVDKATMAQHWSERTENEFRAFRFAVAQLVDVEEDQADADYLLDVLDAELAQPVSYGPFRVDSAVYIPNGRGQATLTWPHGDKVLVPAGSMVNLIVVGVGRG